MAVPTTRRQFKEFCLRRLGYPVIQQYVDDEQVEDRIDEAIQRFWDWHYDGAEKMYLKHQVTAEDKANGYITIPELVQSVTGVVATGGVNSASSLFNVEYQMALNDLWDLSSTNLIYYWMARRHIELFNEFFTKTPPISYNKHSNKLQLFTDWSQIQTGTYLVFETYRVLDPDTYTDMWRDPWLYRYTCALIKRQIGEHAKRYTLTLPGNVQINGQQLYDEADRDIEKLEQELIDSSIPPMDIIG